MTLIQYFMASLHVDLCDKPFTYIPGYFTKIYKKCPIVGEWDIMD